MDEEPGIAALVQVWDSISHPVLYVEAPVWLDTFPFHLEAEAGAGTGAGAAVLTGSFFGWWQERSRLVVALGPLTSHTRCERA